MYIEVLADNLVPILITCNNNSVELVSHWEP